MAENEEKDEDYLESLLNSVSDNKSDDTDKFDYKNDENDIEELLNMLDNSSLDSGSESIKKPEVVSDGNILHPDKKLSPDDNEQIIKSVEDSLGKGLDLSDVDIFEYEPGDPDDLEDRSKSKDAEEEERKKAEEKAAKRAEKEKKRKEKKLKKKAAGKERAGKKAEKKAAKKKKKAEKKKKKQDDRESVPEEKIKIPITIIALSISVVAAVVIVSVYGGKVVWYGSHIDDATEEYMQKDYSAAYDSISGLDLKEKDKKLYNQLKTIMYVQRELDAYENCTEAGLKSEALNSLMMGIEKYDIYEKKAQEYGVEEQVREIYDEILSTLSSQYGLTEKDARDINSIENSQEYSIKINELADRNNSEQANNN